MLGQSVPIRLVEFDLMLREMRKQSARSAHWCVLAALVCLIGIETGIALRLSHRDASFSTESARLSRLSGIHFAIADFDGDWKPDVAVVEAASLRCAQANYAIRLQLSAGAELSFLISAPSGGVRVAARDVNGDNLPDVVVSSVSDERVVAVLLNQGHGQFSRAEPAAYLTMPADPDFFLRGTDESLCDKFTVVSLRCSFDGERVGSAAGPVALSADSVVLPETSAGSRAELHARMGRSPPGMTFSPNDSLTVL